ncbi:MAG TPA: hypothetical protein VFV67_01685 [Actinophytocola sp.]|uniref:hypothetical protein n=1 Tax=Actinophytocola sp. TaxID=1872138 RepID=UPI002DBC6C77|nr:hypothetical protein [Actinophytocola sp.]HEU5469336.1 hypothetical protein [Actinophytocola sp.]
MTIRPKGWDKLAASAVNLGKKKNPPSPAANSGTAINGPRVILATVMAEPVTT